MHLYFSHLSYLFYILFLRVFLQAYVYISHVIITVIFFKSLCKFAFITAILITLDVKISDSEISEISERRWLCSFAPLHSSACGRIYLRKLIVMSGREWRDRYIVHHPFMGARSHLVDWLLQDRAVSNERPPVSIEYFVMRRKFIEFRSTINFPHSSAFYFSSSSSLFFHAISDWSRSHYSLEVELRKTSNPFIIGLFIIG